MSTQTKVFGILGVSLFLLGVVLVCLHLVVHPNVVEPIGVVSVSLQGLGFAVILGALIRAAGGL